MNGTFYLSNTPQWVMTLLTHHSVQNISEISGFLLRFCGQDKDVPTFFPQVFAGGFLPPLPCCFAWRGVSQACPCVEFSG